MTTTDGTSLNQPYLNPPWAPLDHTPDAARVVRILWLRKWHILICGFFCGLIAFILTARQPEMFSAEANVIMDPRKSNVVLSADQIVSDLEFNAATVESEIARIASLAAIGQVVHEMGYGALSTLDPGKAKPNGPVALVDWFKERLSPSRPDEDHLLSEGDRAVQRVVLAIARGTQAVRVGNSFVVRLRVTTVDPSLSTEIANRLIRLYIAQQIAERKSIAMAATQWHESQVTARSAELDKAEQRIETLRRQTLAETGADAEVLSLQLTEIARAYAEVQSNLTAAQSRLVSLERDLAKNGSRAVAEAQNAGFFIDLLFHEQSFLAEDQLLSRDFGKEHPKRKAIAQEILAVDRQIRTAVDNLLNAQRNEVSILAVQENALRQDMELLQSGIVDANAAERQLRQLEIEAASAREGYEELISRLADIRTQSDLQLSDARILNLAQIPTGPSAPRPKFVGLIGALVGVSIGFFVVLVYEAMAPSVRTREELQAITNTPSVAVLPIANFGKAANVVSQFLDWRYAPLAENLRQLQTVTSHRAKGSGNVILVTSARPKEGCSSVAYALAYLYGEAGEKTLFVEARASKAGLAEPDPQTHRFDIWHTAADLTMDRCNALLDALPELCTQYDIIVIDGPPILAQSQGLRIAKVADQILFVVEHLRTPRKSITGSFALLQSVGAFPSVAILNKADTRLDPDTFVDHL